MTPWKAIAMSGMIYIFIERLRMIDGLVYDFCNLNCKNNYGGFEFFKSLAPVTVEAIL